MIHFLRCIRQLSPCYKKGHVSFSFNRQLASPELTRFVSFWFGIIVRHYKSYKQEDSSKRALGNRSILSQPTLANQVRNKKEVKERKKEKQNFWALLLNFIGGRSFQQLGSLILKCRHRYKNIQIPSVPPLLSYLALIPTTFAHCHVLPAYHSKVPDSAN
jgi:hypothetical protein